MTVQLIPVEDIGNISRGDDLALIILQALEGRRQALADGDVVVVTHKIVSKAEGAVVTGVESDLDYRRIVEQEAVSIIRRRGDLV
ncbi:MAG: coenzyme F420-0:L-glutamate ligase, partial [Acidimicrobiia bacterium]|nr:coenzyme F420-0:L-glutamate ligase [Acidimicrobiia bacterium]